MFQDIELDIEKFETNTTDDYSACGSIITPWDWTAEEEKKVVRKLDMTLMPLLILVFFTLSLDRGNIGYALTDFFLEDVGITQYQYNIGQQLVCAGVVLVEIPSNMILYRFGAHKCITGQVLAWGLVALFQGFQHGVGAYFATRILLGICEGGFVPGGLYVVSTYYKRDETSRRFALYYFGASVASAANGLLAYGILQMRGICGLGGWQWMFIIEGIFTLVCGGLFFMLLPRSSFNPRPWISGIRYFTDREEYILSERVHRDDPSKIAISHNITTRDITSTLTNWKLYPHLIVETCAIAPIATMCSYGPSLVSSFGFERLPSNALVSVGYWIHIPLGLLAGYLADKTRRRGLVSLGCLILWWASVLGCLLVSGSDSKSARYALLVCALSVKGIFHPVNGSWLSANTRSPGERSIAMAMFISSANCGGIIGSQLFQESDAPRYKIGWTVMVCLLSVGIAFNLVSNVQYRFLNRKIIKQEEVARQRGGGGGGVMEVYHL